MPIGTCKLCLQQKKLQRSHLIGKAIFRLCREENEDPVVMTPQIVFSSDRQFRAHLLCQDCEGRFSKHGEDYTMRMIQGKKKEDFRLLNFINLGRALQLPRARGVPYVGYPGRELGIDTDKLAYFALSIAWRSAAHTWPTLNGQTTSVSLGDYYEPIRQYLLGEAGFPAGVFVAVTAASDFASRFLFLAPTPNKGVPWTEIGLLVRGIYFDIYMGDSLPRELTERCCVRTPKKVVFLADCEARAVNASGFIIRSARVAANVRQRKSTITRHRA